MQFKSVFLKSYSFSILLIISISIGAAVGIVLKEKAAVVKPLGTLFLNLLFTTVIPIVFFSLSSAVAGMTDLKRLGKILGWMLLIFVFTAIVSSLLMIIGVSIFKPAAGLHINLGTIAAPEKLSIADQVVKAFTVSDFNELLSKKNMLALIVFSILIGLASSAAGEKGKAFSQFLISGNEVMTRLLGYVMLYAPIGLGAYFAYLVGVFGPELLGSYFRAMLLYYPLALGYFVVGFTFYVFLAGRFEAVRKFWSNIIPASLTALATGSSVATIPTSLEAAKRIGVPEDIREVVIPIGATIHMDGSCLAAILKIAVLFGLFGMDFSGPQTIAMAIGIAILAGVVVSGIPAGGLLGELMIISLYGFPLEALPLISMIGTLVDPPATMINSVGDNVASMLVARVLEGKNWMHKKLAKPQPEPARELVETL